jgi:putative peptidoglycan lipid II flippase
MALFAGHWFSDPIIAVGVGFTVGGMLQLALQIPFLAKHDALVMPRFAPRDPGVRVLLKRMAPAVFGVAVYQINLMVIRQIGSFLDGQLSCYYNATRLQEFALGVFAVSVSVAALPTLSEHAAKKDYGALLSTYRRALKITNFVTVPATVALVLMSGPIVRVLFRHGNYSEQAA